MQYFAQALILVTHRQRLASALAELWRSWPGNFWLKQNFCEILVGGNRRRGIFGFFAAHCHYSKSC
jgi:hypothetical protein